MAAGTRRFREAGFSLLEVLIATLVLMIGLLGLATLQVLSVQTSQSAYQRYQATFAAYDIVDRMRANVDGARAGSYDIDLGDDGASGYVDCVGIDKSCDPDQLAGFELRAWKLQIGNYLVGGDGEVDTDTVGGITAVTVTVQWYDAQVDGEIDDLVLEAEI